MAELITPPDLTGFVAFCKSCGADRTVRMSREADDGTGEVYYEYMCDECHSVLLTIAPTKIVRQFVVPRSRRRAKTTGEHP
jgi:cytochrome c5